MPVLGALGDRIACQYFLQTVKGPCPPIRPGKLPRFFPSPEARRARRAVPLAQERRFAVDLGQVLREFPDALEVGVT